MASRPAGRRRGPAGISFERRIRMLLALLSLPALVLAGILMRMAQFSWPAVAAGVSVAALALLVASVLVFDQLVRPLQTLANVAAALREEDYSFRARGAWRGDSLGELAAEINALADTLQAQRLSEMEAATLLERVIQGLDAPVLAFDQQQRLRLANPAAERVFAINSPRDLGRTAAQLELSDLLGMKDEAVSALGERTSLKATTDSAPGRWMVRRSSFRQRGLPHTLLLLSDVSAALREEERAAWRRLIRVLGHEIGNSLAPITSIAGSLRGRLPATGESPDFERGLAIIESRAESLNRFVQAYRQLAQLPPPRLKRVPMRPLLEAVTRLEIRMEVTLGHVPDADILADADQMQQLLINLVRNGVEAAMLMRQEGGDAAPNVEVRSMVAEYQAVIAIEDNGPGIGNASNLFVPFYTTKKSGSGVGLVLAQQIAEAHRGSITLRNREDQRGSIAEVRIPLAAAHPDT